MENQAQSAFVEVSDLSLVAFLLAQGATLSGHAWHGAQLAFTLSHPKITELTSSYFSDATQVPIQSYLRALRHLREILRAPRTADMAKGGR